MSAHLPETVDAWRMVAAQRSFSGRLPVSRLRRLTDLLASPEGWVDYRLQFDRDAGGTPTLHVVVSADVMLVCQRTLEPFASTLAVDQMLGLVTDEAAEVAVASGSEPLLVQGPLQLETVIEDELLLAMPLIAVRPGSEAALQPWQPPPEQPAREHPFAALGRLKQH